MALPILDGNQTATTLATTVSGGAHYPNHIIANGTVTANNSTLDSTVYFVGGVDVNTIRTVIYSSSGNGFNNEDGRPVDIDNPLPISGTVTANPWGIYGIPLRAVEDTNPDVGVPIAFGRNVDGAGIVSETSPLPIAGTVTIGAIDSTVTMPVRLFAEIEGGPASGQDKLVLCDSSGQLLINAKVSNSSVIGYDGNAYVQVKQVAGSSTTIGSMPSGALTTRFGSVTTANTAQISSAVTNASRKYLLIQNVTTSSNSITVGIGFLPTTTQGIQLAAGAGLTFDSFVPTGAVYFLSSVTASPITILEG